MLQDIGDFKDPKIHKLVRKTRAQVANLDLFGESAPAELMSDYPLDADGFERSMKMQDKYAKRRQNIERSWNQIQLYMPELLNSPPQDVLELSTTHGATLEILRHYGHNVMGTDYANKVWSTDGTTLAQSETLNVPATSQNLGNGGASVDPMKPDWPYRHVVESVGLPMTVFDLGQGICPFKDKSYDMVMCFHAIDHYGHPDGWMDLIDEFCRISRKSVFVMLNRLVPEHRAKTDYSAAFNTFRREMRSYRKNGFVCTGSFVHWDQALGFKLTAE